MSAHSKYTTNYKAFNSIGLRLVDSVFKAVPKADDVSVVLVSHSMFTGIPAIKAAERIAGKNNLHLILKNSSKNPDFTNYLIANNYNILDLEKEDFRNHPEKVIHKMQPLSKGRGILFLDHGGYGAYHLEDFAREVNFAGIVEYALNGKTRYESRGIADLNIPFTTMAESPIKRDPDYACGRLIGTMTAAEVQTYRGFGVHLRGIVQAGVIGYGKLGSKAGEAMVNSGAHNVMIYDQSPGKQIRAGGEGFNISATSVHDLVKECNVIVVGSDTAPIKPEYYEDMPQDTIISTVTSPDDTLDLDNLRESGVLNYRRNFGRMHTYEVDGKGKFVHLICNGDAPNLKGSTFGVNDTTLFMPLILHALAGSELLNTGGVSEISMVELERQVQEKYLEAYNWMLQDTSRLYAAGKGR